MELPWRCRPKDLRHELLDVMVHLPAILAQYDTAKSLRKNTMELDSLRFDFFQACKNFDEAAQNWLMKLRASVGPELMEKVSDGIPESFELKDVALAITMALYWTMCVVFYGTLQVALAHFQVSFTSCGIEERFDPKPYALNIARSVKFFFRSDAGMVSAQSFSFPMGVAIQYFSSTSAEATPEYRLLTDGFYQGHTGYTIMRFLLSLQKDPAAQISGDDGPECVAEETQYSYVREKGKLWFGGSEISLRAHLNQKADVSA
jgi:hypothetical protein